MSSHSIKGMEEVKLAPSEDRAPSIRVQYTSPGPDMDPRETLATREDQARSQDPSPQDNPQPQDSNQGAANMEVNNDLPGLSFLRKLWRVVEDDAFRSVCWNEDGDNVLIDKDLFPSEVLCRRGADKIFESDSLKTFIRLMNLYGFVKIRLSDSSVASPGNKIMIYRNFSFQRDKPWLMENIKTKGNQMTSTWPGTSATPSKRKKQLTPKRHSPRIHRKESTREGNRKAQKKATDAWGPSDSWPFKFSGLKSTSSAMRVQHTSEPGGPSGEGTSRNAMFVPTATAGTNGTGALPTRPPNYPLYDSVMCLYNTCYSLLMAALSVISPSEEEEGSSDYKSVFCEPVKDNTRP